MESFSWGTAMITLDLAIQRIERFLPNFNYEDARVYAAFVRQFYSKMKLHLGEVGLPLETPLVDSVNDATALVPGHMEQRLDAAMSACADYGATVRDVCYWYLREALANERGIIDRAESVYEPLLALLEMGGHFYEHHGALVLSDAATIPFVGR